jgi:hypothetical protein
MMIHSQLGREIVTEETEYHTRRLERNNWFSWCGELENQTVQKSSPVKIK